jgi:phage baseplate assembly protein V
MRDNPDYAGLIGDLIRRGTIDSVDLSNATAVAKVGEVLSPPLPWTELAGDFSTWCPPSEGEQIILLCPEGDIAGAVILRGIHSNANPPPITGRRLRIKMPDGTTLDYDPATHTLDMDLTGGGKLIIGAPGGVEITGDTKITGDVTLTGDLTQTGNQDVTGTVTASEDVVGGGKSLKGHKHTGVQGGAAISGPPQ